MKWADSKFDVSWRRGANARWALRFLEETRHPAEKKRNRERERETDRQSDYVRERETDRQT